MFVVEVSYEKKGSYMWHFSRDIKRTEIWKMTEDLPIIALPRQFIFIVASDVGTGKIDFGP